MRIRAPVDPIASRELRLDQCSIEGDTGLSHVVDNGGIDYGAGTLVFCSLAAYGTRPMSGTLGNDALAAGIASIRMGPAAAAGISLTSPGP